MGDIKVVPKNNPNDGDLKAVKESHKVGIIFKSALAWSCAFCVITIIFFIWHQWEYFSLSASIDSAIWGTFGDFVGGVLGTIVALYSAYLLVRTFQNQIKTNASVVNSNESSVKTNNNTIETNNKIIEQTRLQIFDSRFDTLLDLYLKSIDAYTLHDKTSTIHGRDAFEKLALEFRDMGFENHTEYKRRSVGAVSEYRVLYACRRREMSVHFRMLYLLFKLVAEEKMDDNYRVSYIKTVRGQLSEGELLLLRYNGYTSYGQKMCQYINHFNLLKHLPVMSLLEFSYWRNMVREERKISAIDQVYLVLKQTITQMLDKEGMSKESYAPSSRYNWEIIVSGGHDCITLDMTKQTHKKKGGAVKRPPEETAFDAIVDAELRPFLKDFFAEMFVYSNFCQFNGNNHNIVSVKVERPNPSVVLFHVKIERIGKPFALAQRQVVPVTTN